MDHNAQLQKIRMDTSRMNEILEKALKENALISNEVIEFINISSELININIDSYRNEVESDVFLNLVDWKKNIVSLVREFTPVLKQILDDNIDHN